MRIRTLVPLVAIVMVMFLAWPAFIDNRIHAARAASLATPAPMPHDYAQREALVAFWEGAVRERHHNDMLSPRQLAGQYLARYREKGDIDDVVRAEHMAQASLAIMPRNIAATSELASVMLTLHRFRDALRYTDQLVPYDPSGAQFLSQRASLLMELGEYSQADAALRHIRGDEQNGVAGETVRSRFDELTGHLDRARELLDDATQQVDSHIDEAAQSRAWYHMRAGELAFNAGDTEAAISAEHTAIGIFPTDNLALKDLARFELATHHAREAFDAAVAGARVTPFAETLGYEADAQSALGDASGATSTRATIFAIERIGNAYHVNDRLLAVYYANHHLRSDDALAIARREVEVRGDEIYAQDTLAWAAAMDGHWSEAQHAMVQATRFDTQDPMIQYHAGVIARHFGQYGEAHRRFQHALDLNGEFHPTFADDARRQLREL